MALLYDAWRIMPCICLLAKAIHCSLSASGKGPKSNCSSMSVDSCESVNGELLATWVRGLYSVGIAAGEIGLGFG